LPDRFGLGPLLSEFDFLPFVAVSTTKYSSIHGTFASIFERE
jgi:hypothetical protein